MVGFVLFFCAIWEDVYVLYRNTYGVCFVSCVCVFLVLFNAIVYMLFSVFLIAY